MNIKIETLKQVLGTMLNERIICADYITRQLHGGTLGNVQLVTGIAQSAEGKRLPYSVVLKIQGKWERYGDPDSWRREYDLYASDLGETFIDTFRWPKCYYAEINEAENEIQLWIEYIDGASGLDLTVEMYEQAAMELGRYQGKLYAKKPAFLQNLTNLSKTEYAKNFYLHYRSWNVVYDYIRTENCEIPKHLCKMIIDIDDQSQEIFERIEKLPIVLCHRDFWVANIFYSNGKILLIDWDTTGWGHLGEDIASLIADEADVSHMVEYYDRCIPAYYKGFSEYVDVSHITDNCIYELILIMFGYRSIDVYINAESSEEKALQLEVLQKIYEMRDRNRK